MKEPHLGQVARVIAQHYTLPDIGREGGVDIAHALKAHAVRLNLAHLGNGQKQQVEMLQRFRHSRDKSAMLPTLLGRNLGFAVRPCVVLAEEFAKSAIEVRHGQFCPAPNGTGLDIARQRAQKHLVDGLEEPLDAPATTRLPRRGEDQPHFDVSGDLFEVGGGKIAPVVRVENLGDAEDDPVGIRFPPDCLAQRQGRSRRRRTVEANVKARNRTTVVVDDDGQPRAFCLAIGPLRPQIELGVISMPDLVRARRAHSS
jgi:hypothetical protein